MSKTPEQFDDDDDMFHNPDLMDREGLVAIWLNVTFEEDNKTIGWYDHDYAEGSTLGRLQPIRELLTGGFSYWETWIDTAVQAAEKLGVTEAYNIWMLFDHEYAAPAGPFEIATEEERVDDLTPYYLGAFHFTR